MQKPKKCIITVIVIAIKYTHSLIKFGIKTMYIMISDWTGWDMFITGVVIFYEYYSSLQYFKKLQY